MNTNASVIKHTHRFYQTTISESKQISVIFWIGAGQSPPNCYCLPLWRERVEILGWQQPPDKVLGAINSARSSWSSDCRIWRWWSVPMEQGERCCMIVFRLHFITPSFMIFSSVSFSIFHRILSCCLRSQRPFIILSLAKYTVITMGQWKFMVIANIHANSSSKSSLFLTETLTRLVIHFWQILLYLLSWKESTLWSSLVPYWLIALHLCGSKGSCWIGILWNLKNNYANLSNNQLLCRSMGLLKMFWVKK